MLHAFSSTDFVRAPHRGWSPDTSQLLRTCCTPRCCLWKSNQPLRRRGFSDLQAVTTASSDQSSTEPSAQASRSASGHPTGYKIRCLKLEEADQVAELNSEVLSAAADYSCRLVYSQIAVFCHAGLCMD